MNRVLAFDVYGTLIDTHGVVTLLEPLVGLQAQAFSQAWRDKQLEYTFRRGLMQNYQPFDVCTHDALEYTCRLYRAPFTLEQKQALLDEYRRLPTFPDVQPALAQLRQAGVRMFAFSNGTERAVEQLLVQADIRSYFEGVVSCDDLKSFKPNPAVYCHFLRKAEACANETWLISSNPFDVIGAVSAGWRAAWLQRSKATVFDPWDIQPTAIIPSMADLQKALAQPL